MIPEFCASTKVGDDAIAFAWTASPTPTLLLWSNAAMSARAAAYQAALDAPAKAATKEALIRENAKF